MELNMKRNLVKTFFIFIIFTLFITSSVFASDININTVDSDDPTGTTTLEVVEENICNINLGDMATFEKQITDFNATEKSVTLTLTLTNIKTVEESKKDVEIFFVIDNSSSMTEAYIGDKTRKQAVIDAANSLVDKLYEINDKVNIGIVSFSSLDSTNGETEGTLADATLNLELTNSIDTVKTTISNLSEADVGPRTNIEAGLTLADNNFSSEENVDRYVILLTDGVPNNALDGTFGEYSETVLSRTRTKLEEIENKGTQVIGAMINLDGETIEPTTNRTYRDLSEEVFGTEENSTISKYFYIPDAEIEDTIVNDIFDSLVLTKDNSISNITITDYFPQEIIDNFDFEYVASPNIGTVSQAIDTTNNSITWNIELLNAGETASLSYKLTLKDDYDKDIIDQILPTNTNVDITADNNGNELNESSNVSPTIRVKYEEPIIDNTIAEGPLPQTGDNTTEFFVAIITVIAIIAITRIIYLKKYSK